MTNPSLTFFAPASRPLALHFVYFTLPHARAATHTSEATTSSTSPSHQPNKHLTSVNTLSTRLHSSTNIVSCTRHPPSPQRLQPWADHKVPSISTVATICTKRIYSTLVTVSRKLTSCATAGMIWGRYRMEVLSATFLASHSNYFVSCPTTSMFVYTQLACSSD